MSLQSIGQRFLGRAVEVKPEVLQDPTSQIEAAKANLELYGIDVSQGITIDWSKPDAAQMESAGQQVAGFVIHNDIQKVRQYFDGLATDEIKKSEASSLTGIAALYNQTDLKMLQYVASIDGVKYIDFVKAESTIPSYASQPTALIPSGRIARTKEEYEPFIKSVQKALFVGAALSQEVKDENLYRLINDGTIFGEPTTNRSREIKLLIASGANPDAKLDEGHTARMLSEGLQQAGFPQYTQALQEGKELTTISQYNEALEKGKRLAA